MSISTARLLPVLLGLNVALQVFDGLATYYGLRMGYGEGNPIVASMLTALGNAPGLLLVKAYACACLLVIWNLRGRSRLAAPALTATALAYAVGSLGPWSVAFAAR
jgi:hypothetical protein